MYSLNDRQKGALHKRLSELRFLIKDEISVVYNALFYQVHRRLKEIFQCHSNTLFPGLPVFICGDFCQLLPVRGLPVHASESSKKGNLRVRLLDKF